MDDFILGLPEDYKKDINSAIEILKNAGCKEIYLFGSLTERNWH